MKQKKVSARVAALFLALAMAAGVFTAGITPAETAVVLAASKVSESKAEKIALKNAKVSENKAKALYTIDTSKNGKSAWRVSFFKKTADRKYTHYIYFIGSKDGSIIKKSTKSVTIIRPTRAKDIALDEEGYDRDDVDDLDCDLDEYDDKLVYDVSFTVIDDKKGYDYTINARSGNVMDSDDDD